MDNRARAAMIRKVERKIKAKYRKRCLWCFIIALLIGLVLGFLVCRQWFSASTSVSGATVPTPTPMAPVATVDPQSNPLSAPVSTPLVTPVFTPPATLESTIVPTESVAPVETAAPEPTQEAQDDAVDLRAYFGLSADEVGVQQVAEPAADAASQTAIAPTPTPENVLLTVTPEADAQDGVPTDGVPTDGDAAAQTPAQQAVQDPDVRGGKNNPIPIKEAFTFDTQVLANGWPRLDAAETSYDTVTLSLVLNNYLMPDYFASKYADKYKLTGTEAGAEISLTVESSTGTAVVLPQNAIKIVFENGSGTVNEGYQLMDAEIAGRYDVSLEPGATLTIYKRFAYNEAENMQYMVVTYYLDGQEHKVYFKLEVAEPEIVYPTLSKGDRNDEVKNLQERLGALGYLSDTADGIFGANTEAAIKAAQEQAGLSVTGVADNDFQHYIYSASAAHAS